MKRLYFSVFLLITVFCAKDLRAQETEDLSNNYKILSRFYNLPDDGQKNFDHVNFRYGWTSQAPYTIAIQFTNAGYDDKKLKFAIKDVTSNQTILLDTTHNAYFGTETVKANSNSAIWSGTVSNLKDGFALRVWDSDGDSFDQAPISILSTWTQKPKNTPTPTATASSTSLTPINMPTITPTSISIEIMTISGTKPINTSTPTRTPTFTYTPTATYTPTRSQTPAPVFNCVYTTIGDSYAFGEGASCPASTFAHLTAETLKTWYPGIIFEADGIPGSEPSDWANNISSHLENFTKKDGLPIAYVMFQTGSSCFFNVNNGDDRCKDASLSQGVTASYVFQKELDKIIGQIYAANPYVHLVMLDIPDSSGGAGHYAPPEVYEAYRQRLFELKSKYPRMRIADIYTAMKGHAEWFRHEHDDKDHPNNLGQVVIANCILKEFSYWPYPPQQ
jgi:hypothetical protein